MGTNRHALATFLLSAVVLAAAGCASEEPKPASNDSTAAPAASVRYVKVEVAAGGTEVEATAAGGSLRIVNTGKADLLVCDDASCMPPLAPGRELELPISGTCVYHISPMGDGEARAEAHLTGGGEKASVRVKQD